MTEQPINISHCRIIGTQNNYPPDFSRQPRHLGRKILFLLAVMWGFGHPGPTVAILIVSVLVWLVLHIIAQAADAQVNRQVGAALLAQRADIEQRLVDEGDPRGTTGVKLPEPQA